MHRPGRPNRAAATLDWIMALLLEFLTEHWTLAGALVVAVIMLLFHESRRAGPSISPQQAAQLVNREQAVMVDLRDSAEFRKGHVIGAINIPYASFKQRINELDAHRDLPIVLICKMGQHAGSVGKQLAAAGFSKIFRVSGGIGEWQHQQMPLEKG